MAETLPLTVIVLTQDEQENIGPCLESVAWADDLVVVDSGSTDETIVRAKATCPDVRLFEHPFTDFGAQRNWALDEASPRYDWVLFLDADERCTPDLENEIRTAVASPEGRVGFYLTCRNLFLGRWIKHASLYPSWQLRLLRFGQVRYRKEGHGQREVTDGPLGYLKSPYDHYGFSKGVADWIDRHNRYSSAEVELIERLGREPLRLHETLSRDPIRRRRALKRLAARVGFRPLFRFLYLYLLRGGFLDGRPGLIFCLLSLSHELNVTAKLAESRANRRTTM